MADTPIYPDIEVQLSEGNGNANILILKVKRAMEKAGHREDALKFEAEAKQGNYDHLLATCVKWVDVR